MKKDNDEVIAGKIVFTPPSSCRPAGVPGFILFGFQPIFFVQTPKEVWMIYSGDQQVRRVYLDVPEHKGTRIGPAAVFPQRAESRQGAPRRRHCNFRAPDLRRV
jgi:hypothetical protein